MWRRCMGVLRSRASWRVGTGPRGLRAAPSVRSSSFGSSLWLSAATSDSSAMLQSKIDPQLVESDEPQKIWRIDYAPSTFSVEKVDMSFKLGLQDTLVTTRSSITRTDDSQDLELDGELLNLHSVRINDNDLSRDEYKITSSSLVIGHDVLARYPRTFDLITSVSFNPSENLALTGLYTSSSNLLCTQCEAMGFRRITYHLDRPDVLSCYRVYMEGEKSCFPQLLSNGNMISSGDVPGDSTRHFAVWEDPFPKPSYLFGLVAGPLVSLKDKFTTLSGQEVNLAIYSKDSPTSSVSKFEHAMYSLKQSMLWDEKVFGLECDLLTYNVVAVDDFNMGAMENKGLNIFNSAYVLADPATATDVDYTRVLSVIGHEYFHNWTGNRITLRDWFQLTLKEGLTVFREQWFTADILKGKGVQRIEDVDILRNSQFLEDCGFSSHPIRPESYIAMDNFYTSTVYLKGAEIVRMYHLLLGEEGFLKGMSLYVSRHDGQAVTCDDFLAAMRDANPHVTALENFELWYEQPGTPLVTVENTFLDGDAQTFSITLSQKNYDRDFSSMSLQLLSPLPIPVLTSIYDKDTGALIDSSLLLLDEKVRTFQFENVHASSVVVSPLQSFSAPVILSFPQQTEDDLTFLLQHDTDSFNKWECQQKLSSSIILRLANQDDTIMAFTVPDAYVDAFKKVLASVKHTPSGELGALAALLSFPSVSTLLQQQQEYLRENHDGNGVAHEVDVEKLHMARAHVMHILSMEAERDLIDVYNSLTPPSSTFQFNNEEVGRRSLRNACLKCLTARQFTSQKSEVSEENFLREEAAAKLLVNMACDQYYSSSGSCMTDSVAALTSLLAIKHFYAKIFQDNALVHFYHSADSDSLVLNKWFTMLAAVESDETYENVLGLKEHESFSMSNPNAVRALVGTFANNTLQFHHPSGRGYDFLADCVVELDQHNPQMAAKLTQSLSKWKLFDPKRQELMKEALKKISDNNGKKLSSDTYEIVQNCLV